MVDVWALIASITAIMIVAYFSTIRTHRDNYASPKVTISMPEWRKWITSGKNTLYGDAIIPGGTVNTGWGGNGAVYAGHVRQGIGMYDPEPHWG